MMTFLVDLCFEMYYFKIHLHNLKKVQVYTKFQEINYCNIISMVLWFYGM